MEIIELDYTKTDESNNVDDDHFDKFLLECNNNMAKCKYKKVFNDICAYEQFLFENSYFWKIKLIKLKSIIKLIKKKKANPEIKTTKPADYWVRQLETEFDSMWEFIQISKKNQKNRFGFFRH